MPGGPASGALAPELPREEMSFSWLVCSPEVARLHLKVTEAAVAYGRERAIRNDQLLNAGLDPAAIAKVVRGQTGTLEAFFRVGDLVVEAADALIAEMRTELGALGALPPHNMPTLDEINSALVRYIQAVGE